MRRAAPGDHAASKRLTCRSLFNAGAATGGFLSGVIAVGSTAFAAADPYADPAEPALPASDMVLDKERLALVVTDAQVDFLSPDGVTWGGPLKQDFEVAIVRDATVAAVPPEGDGYLAAITDFRSTSNGVWTTDQAVASLASG